jgi:diguanylate cyclase (GGDEF)-like protein
MNKDQIAVYLNEHLEFFNDYPELLQKIHSIPMTDLPLEPLKTLSIADRIIKRANADKEHLRSRLDWFLEIAEANEWVLQHLAEIEQMTLTCTHFPQMINHFCAEMGRRFDIRHVQVCLVDGADHFIADRLRERFADEELKERLFFTEQDAVTNLFPDGLKTVLKGALPEGSGFFNSPEARAQVRSEALVPIILRGRAAGAIGLGSVRENHFYDGLRTDYLERLADKVGLAIDNLLLLDLLKHRPALDRETGFYNPEYLDPVFLREFDRAQRFKIPLACIKMQIDYFDDLVNTHGRNSVGKIVKKTGTILKENCRGGDVLFRSDNDEFFVLLPGIDGCAAERVAERIRVSLSAHRFANGLAGATVTASLGVAAMQGDAIRTHRELIQAAADNLVRAVEQGRNRVISHDQKSQSQ